MWLCFRELFVQVGKTITRDILQNNFSYSLLCVLPPAGLDLSHNSAVTSRLAKDE